jgi:hypothetical protein
LIADVKLAREKLDIEKLKQKALRLINEFKEYKVEYKGFYFKDVKLI